MIFRKPYAFLIKNFKKIHLILFLAMGFLFYKSYSIYSFFAEYINNNYSTVSSLDSITNYTSFIVYLILIIILIVFIAIYYLLQHKNKPRKFYLYSIIYYVVLLIFFSYMSGFFKNIFEIAIESKTIRAYRDISLIAMFSQIPFIIYSLITVVGFNIKKFNFGEDLKEFEISAEDNEEFELNVGFEGYKTKRSIRKTIRELKYYVLENKFVISCIGIILVVILAISLISTLKEKNNNLKGNAYAVNNNFSIKVMDSIISNLYPNGEVIENGKYYLAVKIEISNITNSSVSLDYSNYRLVTKGKRLVPNLQASHYFYDFGLPYMGDKLRIGETRIINLAYEISKSDLDNKFVLKIYKGTFNKDDKLVDDYNEVKLNPLKQLDKGDANIVLLNDELSFNNSNVGDTRFTLKAFEYASSYTYSYDVCHNNDCKTVKDIVTIDYLSVQKDAILMILDYDFLLDDKTAYYKYNNTLNSFVTNFMKFKYVIDGEIKYSSVINRTPLKVNDKLIIQVDKDVSVADEVQMIFTIRNKNYIIKIK